MLLARGNFARQVLFPDMINFVDPNLDPGAQIREVNNRIRRGMDVAMATSESEPGQAKMSEESGKAMANILANNEEFNTRFGSITGWSQAVRAIKPILRDPAQLTLSKMALAAQLDTSGDV